MTKNTEAAAIAGKFGISDISDITELRTGHINRTLLLTCGESRYIMQSLNRDIFRSPETVMGNISLISQAFRNFGDGRAAIPDYLECDGKNYAEADGEIWRIYRYTADSAPYSPYAHGYAVGTFLRVVNSSGIVLSDPLPELHSRFRELGLPMRNIHGDTKSDNVIFGDIPTIIDLDTASRNTVLVDYGDMIRSLTAGGFDAETVRRATKGFADGLEGLLTAEEIDQLYSGVILIVTELMERYLDGQRNFPNRSPEQCRKRAEQLAGQLDRLSQNENELKAIIIECFE